MIAPAQVEAERAEYEAVLHSGIFNRAPNLANFFRYTCERYFLGEADTLKEYNIAVEALGRPTDFNQKKDSIVRVEAHRLRKRLNEYYANEGAGHSVHITIPSGKYVPQFVAKSMKPVVEPKADIHQIRIVPMRPVEKDDLHPTKIIWITLAALCVVMCGAFFEARRASALPDTWQGSLEPVQGELRILAGYSGRPYTDRQGRVWESDRYYKGGVAVAEDRGRTFEGVPDPGFARWHREGDFSYRIPMPPGNYEMRLYFVETRFGLSNTSENARTFRVAVNGKAVLNLFDVLAEAGGPNRQHVRVFRDVSPAHDGLVHLTFERTSDGPAFVNALELLPTRPGSIRPIRLVAQSKNVVDGEGIVWYAEQYAIGGNQVNRELGIGPLGMLFRGERFGNFAYHIPVAAGRYRVRLYFAETYFDTKLPYAQNNQAAPRIFDVFANGVALIRNLNIEAEAGGSNKPLVKEFRDVEANAQGMIVLEFVPVHNYAEINAIEVLPAE